MSCIAIIPARAGSKGLPGKNTALINGKSLVQLAIETALSIPEITRVVVTSDDVSVQKIANDLGVEVVVRPAELAQDNSPIESAILHALAELNLDPTTTDVLTIIQPTSPLRDKQLLATSISSFIKNGSEGSLFGVIEVEHHPAKMLVVNGEFVVPLPKLKTSLRRGNSSITLFDKVAAFTSQISSNSLTLAHCFSIQSDGLR